MRRYLVIAVIFFITAPIIAVADSASSTSFIIESGAVDSGGGRSTSSGFGLQGSLSQPGTGISSSTSFVLRGGFLNFPLTAPPPPPPAPSPSPSPTPSPAPTGGVGGGTGFIEKRYEPLPPGIISRCDFNGDGRCNIIDLSILLFYYGKSGSAISRYDLNSNGVVDFPDVSIMMYYWTG